MKSTIISMLVVLVVLVALPVFFLGGDRMSGGLGFDLDLGGGSPASNGGVNLSSGIESVSTDSEVQIYRWRDANGILQFSNTPPPQNVSAELIELKPSLGSMPATPIPPETAAVATDTAAPAMEPGNPYTPGGMKKMVEQANELKKIISQQQANHQEAIEEILPQMKTEER